MPEAAVAASAATGLWGLVVALQANYCSVALEASAPGATDRLLCTRRSRLGHQGLQVCVGDRVRLEGVDWGGRRAAVVEVAPRRNLLARPSVANVSRVLVVTALAEPALDLLQLTRFLVAAEGIGAAVDLVLGKADLLDEDQLKAIRSALADWGYAPWILSCRSGAGLEVLRRSLAAGGGLSVICGPSGVGKSSLLNALIPGLALRVAEVSGRLQRGRHTTRHVELFALADPQTDAGGTPALLADTPGFNRPALPADPNALALAFPELRRRLERESCRFRNCRHLGDPGCAMGTEWPRFPLYRQCLAEVENEAAGLTNRPSRSSRRSAGGSGRLSPPDRED